jgi:hypothetical protein
MRLPFEITPLCIQMLADIERLLGRYEGLQLQRPTPLLRTSLRAKSVQGSVAIEGKNLTEEQVTALIDGKRVVGLPARVFPISTFQIRRMIPINPSEEVSQIARFDLVPT